MLTRFGQQAMRSATTVMLVLCCGCSPFWVMRKDTREFTSGNIDGWAYLPEDGRPLYAGFRFGNPKTPYDGKPLFYVRLPNGRVSRSDHISRDFLAGYTRDYNPDRPPASLTNDGWPETAKFIASYALVAIVDRGSVLMLDLFSHTDERVAVSRAPDGPFYRLPLTEAEMHEVFGAMSFDSVTDFFGSTPEPKR